MLTALGGCATIAAAEPSQSGAALGAFALGELLVVLLLWALASWLLFSLFWQSFDMNPFLAVRGAYFVNCSWFLAYLCWVFYPRHLAYLVGESGLDAVRWFVAGGALLVLILLCAITYHGMPERPEQAEAG